MARILIVDDQELNLRLLTVLLDGLGHVIVTASDGDRALAIARAQPPDLAIIDVVMPGRDGYATAAALKDMAGSDFLPIVLVTALSDHEARLRGLRSGADEYLTYPVDPAELLLRVRSLLALRVKGAALARRNEKLMELQRFRDEMSEMVVHDLKNPLAIMRLNLDFVLTELGLMPGIETDLIAGLADARLATGRMTELISNLLDVSRVEDERLTLQRATIEIDDLIEPVLRERESVARLRSIDLQRRAGESLLIDADRELVTRVVENILDNALRHTPSGGRIEVAARASQGGAELRIGNTGRAIPVEARTRIFDKFVQSAPSAGGNLGLGLYFCRLVAEAHGGRIWVEETMTLPAMFALTLPSPAHAA